MEPKEVIEVFRKNITEHYFDMNGRVCRKEFWYFVLASVVIGLAAAIVDTVLGTSLVRPLVSLALLLPTAGLGARRLQDIGRNKSLVWIWIGVSAAMQILAIVTVFMLMGSVGYGYYAYGAAPLFGTAVLLGGLTTLVGLATLALTVVLIYFWAQPGVKGENQYGPDPLASAPATVSAA